MPANNNPYSNLTDDVLLAAYRKDGDKKWLGHLLQRYTALLLGVALKYMKNKSEAEDAVQQVFLKTLTHLPKEEIINFKGWLYVLMRNYCLGELRDKIHNSGETAMADIPEAIMDIESIQWHEETLEQMNEAIDSLNEDQKKTIVLFYLKKHSYQQIIEETGYTFMQVKSHIQNGKRNLKAFLLKTQRHHSS